MKKTLSVMFSIVSVFALCFNTFARPEDFTKSHALFYKISGKDLKKPSYIYGTIHLICQNDMFGMDKLNGYIDQSEQVLMEIDMDDPAVMQAMVSGAAMPNGKTLNDLLGKEQYAKVDEMVKNYLGVSADAFKSYRPMMLSVGVYASPKALGCQQLGSYDLSFMQTAVAKNKPVEGLETIASQFEKIDRKPAEEQAKELYEMALDPDKSINEFKEAIADYKAQNFDFSKSMKGKFGSQEFEKGLLDERNIDWIPKIEKAIGEKTTFIAVGAGHLGGENGVLNLLQKKGYKLEGIKL